MKDGKTKDTRHKTQDIVGQSQKTRTTARHETVDNSESHVAVGYAEIEARKSSILLGIRYEIKTKQAVLRSLIVLRSLKTIKISLRHKDIGCKRFHKFGQICLVNENNGL
jgi:hypothetical protein